jgi:hypothetical protein
MKLAAASEKAGGNEPDRFVEFSIAAPRELRAASEARSP